MHRRLGLLGGWMVGVALMGAAGCAPSGVGDPCTPEQIPSDGFNKDEAYVETSSVQCRTRVCLVYKLQGDPRKIEGTGSCTADDKSNNLCVTEQEEKRRVACSCRCEAPAGTDTPTCSCPSGFRCAEVLSLGGPGIRGSYCVSKEALCCTAAGDFEDVPVDEDDCSKVSC